MTAECVWGVVGAGRVARQVARAIGETPGHRVGAVVSRTRKGAAAFAVDLGIEVSSSDSLDDLAGVDVAYVASPNDQHAEHVARLLAAGIPVLCEKPLAPSVAAAREIHAAASVGGPRVGVAFQYRQHPAHRRARELMVAGVLGKLRFVQVSACLPSLDVPDWYTDSAVSGGGILPMSGVHRVDLARHLVGLDYLDVSATVANHRGRAYDDTATIAARFVGGVGCTFQFGLDVPYGDDRIAIHGTAASLVLESTMSQWWSTAPGTLTLRSIDGTVREQFEEVDNYRLQVEDFARFADGRSAAIATLDDALAVAEFTAATYASAAEARSVVLGPGQP